jgi:hypothetical protein
MTRRWLHRIAALGLVVSAVAVAPQVEAVARPTVVPASNRLVMVSDSVGLGAIPQMKAAFGAAWQVTVTGKPGLFTESLVGYANAVPLGAYGDNAIVATGYNYPYWDPARFDRSIDQMVAALKAKGVKRIFWVTIREVKPAYYRYWNGLSAEYKRLYGAYPTANNQLRRATDRHPQLSIIDWAAVSDRVGLTSDPIHLNLFGATTYAALARGTVLSGVTRRPAGTVSRITMAGARGVPADAAAVSLNLTATNPRRAGYLVAWPCDEPRPPVVHLWHHAAQTISSATVVPLGPSGTVCVFQSTDSHVMVDLNGWVPTGQGYVPMRGQRLWVTPTTGAPAPNAITKVRLSTAVGAPTPPFTTVVTLLTQAVTGGDVRLFTCGAPLPLVPSRTLEGGQTQTLTQLVRTDANGDVCVQYRGTGHQWLSIVGAFDATADVKPFAQRRIVDTQLTGGALVAGQVRRVTVAGTPAIPAVPTASGAWLTVTLRGAGDSSAVKVWPCSSPAPGSVYFYTVPNHPRSNVGLMGLGTTGQVCISSSVAGHVTVDASGWTGTAVTSMPWTRVLDTRA